MSWSALGARHDSRVMAPVRQLPDAPAADGWVWIDAETPTEAELAAAARAIGVDVALIDALPADAYPTARVGPDSLIVVTRSLTTAGERVTTTPVVMVLGRGGLLTIRLKPLPGASWLADRAREQPAIVAGGPDGLLVRAIDVGAQRFAPLIDELDHSIEGLEDRAMDAHPDVLPESHALRRDASALRGVMRAQREMIRGLVRAPGPLVTEQAKRRLEDVFDLHQRIVESLETSRQMLTGVIEVYRSAVAERTNEVMKVLTVFSAILLPMGVIAGIYGMNFVNIPELQQRGGYFVVLGVMAAVATGLWLYFAHRGFIGGPRRARRVGVGLFNLALLPVKTLTTVGKVVAGVVLPPGEARPPPERPPEQG